MTDRDPEHDKSVLELVDARHYGDPEDDRLPHVAPPEHDGSEEDDGPGGTLVLADERGRSLTWHHSVEFDGFVHKAACGRVVDTDDVRDVLVDPVDGWHRDVTPSNGCGTCHDSVYQRHQFAEDSEEVDRDD